MAEQFTNSALEPRDVSRVRNDAEILDRADRDLAPRKALKIAPKREERTAMTFRREHNKRFALSG
jgi:hypothetical protein